MPANERRLWCCLRRHAPHLEIASDVSTGKRGEAPRALLDLLLVERARRRRGWRSDRADLAQRRAPIRRCGGRRFPLRCAFELSMLS